MSYWWLCIVVVTIPRDPHTGSTSACLTSIICWSWTQLQCAPQAQNLVEDNHDWDALEFCYRFSNPSWETWWTGHHFTASWLCIKMRITQTHFWKVWLKNSLAFYCLLQPMTNCLLCWRQTVFDFFVSQYIWYRDYCLVLLQQTKIIHFSHNAREINSATYTCWF